MMTYLDRMVRFLSQTLQSYPKPFFPQQLQHVFIASPNYKKTADRAKRTLFGTTAGDHLTELNALTAYEQQVDGGADVKRWCQSAGLNARGLQHALYLRDKIAGVLKRAKLPWVAAEPAGNAQPVLRALLRGFFTQVCMFLMAGKGQIAQKDHIGAKIDLGPKLRVNISIYKYYKLKKLKILLLSVK